MKSGGEPSSSLKHKFSKRLHGLLGRWAPSFLSGESENSVCVWSAEDASVGLGWLPATKVNIWAKSLRLNDRVYGRVKLVCVCIHKRECVSWHLQAFHYNRWSNNFRVHILALSCCCIRTHLDTANLFPNSCSSSAAKQAADNSLVICTATTTDIPLNQRAAIVLRENPCGEKCLELIEAEVYQTQAQQHSRTLETLKITGWNLFLIALSDPQEQ